MNYNNPGDVLVYVFILILALVLPVAGWVFIRDLMLFLLPFGIFFFVIYALGRIFTSGPRQPWEYHRDRDLRKLYYKEYIRSPEWRQKRLKALRRDNFTCQVCGKRSRKGLHVHHLRYPQVLGTESISDLITLCSDCHSKEHSRKRR